MSKTHDIKKFILDNPKMNSTQLAKKLGTTPGYIKKCRYEMKRGNMSFEDPKNGPSPQHIDAEIVERRRQAELKLTNKKYEELLTRYEQLMGKYDEALMLKEFTEIETPTISINPEIKSQAVPVIQFSDWHVEEKVEKGVTGGMNEFNPTIARKRVEKLAINTLKVITKERQDVKIESIVICLGGDFINNYLHEHDVQMNFMSPVEAAMFAKELIKECLVTIAENAKAKKIVLMCIRGNHGRLTKKMQSSNDYKMNLEAIIYHTLKQELSDKIFEWHIPESELGYVEVYGRKIRAFHGHQVNYQGGVGDITVPVNKAIQKWDKTLKADHNLMHHFHSYWMPTRNCSLNGSLVGFNSYALSKGFPYEPPLQTFHLLDAKRGFTVRVPIMCE